MGVRLTEDAVDLIDGRNFGHLATLMSDGSPHVTPVWVDREGDLILVNTAVGRIKQRNLTRDPRVAIDVVDQENPYQMVSIRGHVVAQSQEGADEHIDRLAKKYLGKDKYPYRQLGEKRIILKVELEKIITI
ncbi:MAG: PPOX class F420-dependent oxidoreductase [Nitrososphaerales archaeon]